MMEPLRMTVSDVCEETGLVRSIVLAPDNGGLLPGFSAGSHIRVQLPGGGDRAYSLIHIDLETDPADGVASYKLGVRLEDESTGGSRYMHDLVVGDTVTIEPPKNDFPLQAGKQPAVFFAGGIGITPLMSMAAELAGRKADYILHYAGRSRGQLAFVASLQELFGQRLVEHYDDEPDSALAIAEAIRSAPQGADIYVCGPKGMIEAVQEEARAQDIPDERVHFELFTNSAQASQGDAFEIELSSSGDVLTVPAGKTIIEVLEEAGHDVLYDCQRGDCGICQVDVISGVPDHRDVVLSDDEKAAGKVMQICVSRAKSQRLVLDL